ncbi:MAG: AzlC family ABC transporter permease [Actinomycetota bacterium]
MTADQAMRRVMLEGARSATPLAMAIVPFGLVYGVAVADSSVDAWLGLGASWIVLAGAAQLTLLSLIDEGATWPVVVGTALLINARFALYSAALAPAFGRFPMRWRLGLSYLVTDQAASLAVVEFEVDRDPIRRRWWFFAAGMLIACGWWIGSVLGYALDGALPNGLDIDVIVPVMFVALLVPTMVDRRAAVAAAVAGIVAIAGARLPSGLGIVIGAVLGIAVARWAGGAARR